MTSHSPSRFLTALVAVALAAGTVVGRAATVTWDADGTTGGVSDGSGVWLGASQWWNGTSNVTWTSGDDAVFGVSGTGGTVTLSATTAAGSLTFNPFSGTYTLGTAGQTLTLGSGGLTMNAGAGAVTLLSPVTLSAAQSWTNNSASLLTTSAALANGGNLLTVAGSGNATLAAILGTGGLTKSGAGTLTLAGANTYTGGTIVSGGTLTLAPGTVSGNFNGVIRDSLTVSSGATVNATQAWSLGAGGPNSSVPTSRSVTDITLTGGTLNIALNATTKGGMSPTTITMTAGSLTGELVQWYYGNSSTVSLITNASGTTSTVSAPVALRLNKTAGAGSLTFNVAAGATPDGVDLLVSGAISNAAEEGAGGQIIKKGAGTLRMTAINSYTEGTTVQAGTLSLGNGGANGVIRGSLAIQSGARVVASAEGWSLGYGGTRTGAIFAGNSVTAITIDGGTLEFTAAKSGAGLAANAITLTGGTIAGASFGWINSNTLTPTLRTLPSATRSTLQGGISLRLSTSGTLTFDVATGSTSDGIDLFVSGGISDAFAADNIGGVLVKAGAGTLVLAGANTSTGGVVVSGGTLAVQGSMAANQNYTISNAMLRTAAASFNTLGVNTSGTVTINSGGILFADNTTNNAHSVANIVLAGGTMGSGTGLRSGALANYYVNGAITATGSTTSTISASLGRTGAAGASLAMTVDAGSTLNVSGPIVNISGNNPLTKSGDGRLVLSGSNTFSGGLTLSAGQLDLNTASSLGSGAFTIAGGTIGNSSSGAVTLSTNNTQTWNSDFTFAGPNNLNLGLGGVVLGANRTVTVASGLLTVGGGISGTAGLTKSGGGSLTLTGSSTFNGGVTVTGGTLAAQGINGSIGSLQPNQNFTITNATLTTTGTLFNAFSQFWTSGTTTINAGGLLVAGNSTNNAHNVGSVVLAGGSMTSGTGSLGAGLANWYVNGDITATGGTTSTISALLGKVATNSALAVSVDAGSTLAVSGRIVNISGANGLTKSGAGLLVLSGSNTFSGATAINGGRLQIDSSGSLTATSGITINGGELNYNSATPLTRPITFTAGRISGTGSIGTAVTVAANDILSPGNSPGAQSYTAGLTWSGSGSYLWELNDLSGTAGVNWDVINVSSGTFDLAGLSAGNRFILDLTTLTGNNALGPLDSAYDGGSYSFVIATYTSLSTPLGTAALTDLTSLFNIRLDDWASPTPTLPDVSVRINSAANGLELVIVPEPGAVALAAIGTFGVAWVILRRRRRGERTAA